MGKQSLRKWRPHLWPSLCGVFSDRGPLQVPLQPENTIRSTVLSGQAEAGPGSESSLDSRAGSRAQEEVKRLATVLEIKASVILCTCAAHLETLRHKPLTPSWCEIPPSQSTITAQWEGRVGKYTQTRLSDVCLHLFVLTLTGK